MNVSINTSVEEKFEAVNATLALIMAKLDNKTPSDIEEHERQLETMKTILVE